MPSPFPGMDPYFEAAGEWPDFLPRFLTYACDTLAEHLPDRYDVKIDECVLLEGGPEGGSRLNLPDVAVLEGPDPRPRRAAAAASVATLEPVSIPRAPMVVDELVERSIHILRRPGRTLVTVVELLSPSNKVDPGRGRYDLKRAELMRRGVHLVEIDLLVAGHRLPLGGPFPPGDHFAVVSRGGEAHSEVYAWTLRQPLPTIPLPLSDPDPEIPFDLGAVFAYTYEKGRYARTLPYGEDVDLPLGEADRSWIRERAGAARG